MKRRAATLLVLAIVAMAALWFAARSGMVPEPIRKGEHAMMAKLRGWKAHLALALATATPAAAPAADMNPAPAGPVPPTRIGLHLSTLADWTPERSYANLTLSGHWLLDKGQGWKDVGPDDFTPDGRLALQSASHRLNIYPIWPHDGEAAPHILCTYSGKGSFKAFGEARDVSPGRNTLRFTWPSDTKGGVWMIGEGLDPKAPIGDMDCREQGLAKDVRFYPAFITLLKNFPVLRFMDWQRTNSNDPVTWATRHTLKTANLSGADGAPIEDMMLLAKQADADPWFNMPWNGDADYIRHFAQYVHDNLAPGHHVYVETSNEVWNDQFGVARQATQEGLKSGLATDPGQAKLKRYAQKTIEVMKIWEAVFTDDPARLVRVASTQHVNSWSAKTVFAYPGLAQHVDALATAPYFGEDLMTVDTGWTEDPNVIFARLTKSVDNTIRLALENKAVAAQYHKRYIAYEAGQGVTIGGHNALVGSIERDQRMYGLYRRFMDAWRSKVGDTLVMLTSTASIGDNGWGLQEYSGQPLADAPKMRAVLESK